METAAVGPLATVASVATAQPLNWPGLSNTLGVRHLPAFWSGWQMGGCNEPSTNSQS
jgi:hypothetical protein